MAIPNTPSNLLVQQANGQVYVSFDQVSNALTYGILRSTDNVNYTSVATPAVPNYLDTAVTVGTQYWYKVNATNGDGTSANSAAQSTVPTESGQLTLGQVRLQAQQRADMVNSNFVSTTEWNDYIRSSYQELYDLLINVYEDWALAAPYVLITDGINNAYTLPNGIDVVDATTGLVAKPFYKLMGVDMGLANNNNAWVTVHKYDFVERNRYVYPNITSTFAGVFNLRYRIMGNSIRFIPTPSAGQYMRMWYAPRLLLPLADTDIMDGVGGWLEYVVTDAAIKAMQKEESDVTVLAIQKQALLKRIEESAINRDISEPDRISNNRRNGEGGYGWGGWDGSWGGT